MTARNTKGLTISVVKAGATPTTATLTRATAGATTTLDVASTAAYRVGDMIFVSDKATGLPQIDNKWHVIMAIDAGGTEFTVNVNTTGGTVALGATPTFKHYVSATDLQGMCWSSLTLNVDEPDTQSVGTYCDPTATVSSGATAAGTISFAGFVDVSDNDYKALVSMIENATPTAIRINLPNNGYLIAPVTFSSMTWDLPLDGAIGYSGTATLGSKMVHVF